MQTSLLDLGQKINTYDPIVDHSFKYTQKV